LFSQSVQENINEAIAEYPDKQCNPKFLQRIPVHLLLLYQLYILMMD